MQNGSKTRLGRGLAALIGDDYKSENENKSLLDNLLEPTASNENSIEINIHHIYRNKDNPRYNFSEEEIKSLSESIKEYGVLQPIIVTKLEDNRYQIIAGERRWRASLEAGLSTIPAIVREVPAEKKLEWAIIENIQRVDLGSIEEAIGYKQLIELYGYTQEQLAKKMGKSRTYITNMVRLLSLPEEVKALLDSKQISMGHARCLINHPNAVKLANRVVEQQLSVRQLEQLAQLELQSPLENLSGLQLEVQEGAASYSQAGSQLQIDRQLQSEIAQQQPQLDQKQPGIETKLGLEPGVVLSQKWQEFESQLKQLIGLDLKLKVAKKGGQLIIKYSNIEQLADLCSRIKN